MSGFFSPADICRFSEARDDAHHMLRCGPNEHVTLVDIRGMQIQGQESVAEFAALLSRKEHASKRIAFVVSQSLARLQIQRAASGRDAGYFIDDPIAAEQWLFAHERVTT
ncbi:hypothetical protein GCM10009102_29560 [Sphingomonas insulae]|uniref:STAS/SEC14 domain-containing protein n=1 Tax=Sphingomonas insulae TaxID=424800 RepID=A0ABP3T5T1_9SPHN